jgi:hypothetical protein
MFPKEENEVIQKILKINFDIRSKVCEYSWNNEKKYFINVNKENSSKMIEVMKPYLDEYEYKYTADLKSNYMLEPPNVDNN